MSSFALLVNDFDGRGQISSGELDLWRPEPGGD
jgi:hypothetical protein